MLTVSLGYLYEVWWLAVKFIEPNLLYILVYLLLLFLIIRIKWTFFYQLFTKMDLLLLTFTDFKLVNPVSLSNFGNFIYLLPSGWDLVLLGSHSYF